MTGDQMRSQFVSLFCVALLAAVFSGCGKKSDGKDKLPPPTGAGATPRKELPKLPFENRNTKPNFEIGSQWEVHIGDNYR